MFCLCACSLGFFSPSGASELPATGISMDRLQHIGGVFSTEPEDFNIHNGGWVEAICLALVVVVVVFVVIPTAHMRHCKELCFFV